MAASASARGRVSPSRRSRGQGVLLVALGLSALFHAGLGVTLALLPRERSLVPQITLDLVEEEPPAPQTPKTRPEELHPALREKIARAIPKAPLRQARP